jgi:hypothetical protein
MNKEEIKEIVREVLGELEQEKFNNHLKIKCGAGYVCYQEKEEHQDITYSKTPKGNTFDFPDDEKKEKPDNIILGTWCGDPRLDPDNKKESTTEECSTVEKKVIGTDCSNGCKCLKKFPQEGDKYWAFEGSGGVFESTIKDSFDFAWINAGSGFQTKEEAEAVRDLRKHEALHKECKTEISLLGVPRGNTKVEIILEFENGDDAIERAEILKRLAKIRGLI